MVVELWGIQNEHMEKCGIWNHMGVVSRTHHDRMASVRETLGHRTQKDWKTSFFFPECL